jgi:ketosteroid isomerase-like protein
VGSNPTPSAEQSDLWQTTWLYRDTARAMSQENVEIVRRIFEASAQRDTPAVLALYDKEVEVDNTHGPARAFLGGRSIYYGHEGLRAFFGEWYEAWKNVESNLLELIDADEHVVSVHGYRGRGRASGVEVEWPDLGGIWTIRNGKVIRVRWFPTRAEALQASGLPE